MIDPKPICRHCRQSAVNRPRGLCWTCYYTPGVKALHPITSKFAQRGRGLGNRFNPPLPEPTRCAPGTPEKLAVLERRAKRGEAIFHPLDARYEGDDRAAEDKRRGGWHNRTLSSA